MIQLYPEYLLWSRRKTLTGSPDPTRANGTNEPCTNQNAKPTTDFVAVQIMLELVHWFCSRKLNLKPSLYSINVHIYCWLSENCVYLKIKLNCKIIGHRHCFVLVWEVAHYVWLQLNYEEFGRTLVIRAEIFLFWWIQSKRWKTLVFSLTLWKILLI